MLLQSGVDWVHVAFAPSAHAENLAPQQPAPVQLQPLDSVKTEWQLFR
jgi:hypothetical protein